MNWKLAHKRPVIIAFREPITAKETIHTREGTIVAYKGKDYVIKGVKGELYPISKEIFAETYEVIDDLDEEDRQEILNSIITKRK